jgi:hypothetical protein
VKDKQLRPFIGQYVEVRLTSREMVLGRLVLDEAMEFMRTPYAIKRLQRSTAVRPFEARLVPIGSAEDIASIRILDDLLGDREQSA